MEKRRTSEEKEKLLTRARFFLPNALIIFFVLCYIIASILLVVILVDVAEGKPELITAPKFTSLLAFIIPIMLIHIILAYTVKKNKCVVTTKTIKGKIYTLFWYKCFDYRFDKLNEISYTNFLSIKSVKIVFDDGNLLSKNNVLRLMFVENAEEFVKDLAIDMRKIKNDKDILYIDSDKILKKIKKDEQQEEKQTETPESKQ